MAKTEQAVETKKGIPQEFRNRLIELGLKMCEDVETRKYSEPTKIVDCIVKIFEATKE